LPEPVLQNDDRRTFGPFVIRREVAPGNRTLTNEPERIGRHVGGGDPLRSPTLVADCRRSSAKRRKT
jgi:hypothetical protein